MHKYSVDENILICEGYLDAAIKCSRTCLMVRHLGGDVYETAQHYSKEIENDADNIDALLDAAYTHPALADIRLLGLLADR